MIARTAMVIGTATIVADSIATASLYGTRHFTLKLVSPTQTGGAFFIADIQSLMAGQGNFLLQLVFAHCRMAPSAATTDGQLT